MASSVGSQMASNSWKIACLFLIVFLREVSKPVVYISIHEHDVWQKHINRLYRYSLFFSFSPSESLQQSNYFCPLGRLPLGKAPMACFRPVTTTDPTFLVA